MSHRRDHPTLVPDSPTLVPLERAQRAPTLTDSQVEEIREQLALGTAEDALASRFAVSVEEIQQIRGDT